MQERRSSRETAYGSHGQGASSCIASCSPSTPWNQNMEGQPRQVVTEARPRVICNSKAEASTRFIRLNGPLANIAQMPLHLKSPGDGSNCRRVFMHYICMGLLIALAATPTHHLCSDKCAQQSFPPWPTLPFLIKSLGQLGPSCAVGVSPARQTNEATLPGHVASTSTRVSGFASGHNCLKCYLGYRIDCLSLESMDLLHSASILVACRSLLRPRLQTFTIGFSVCLLVFSKPPITDQKLAFRQSFPWLSDLILSRADD